MAAFGKTLMRLPRSYSKGEVIEVKTMVIHPNHNGRRAAAEGLYYAEYYVVAIDVFYGETQLMKLRPSSALSENPYFTFMLKAVRAAPVRVVWTDSKGLQFEHSLDVNV